MLLRRLGLLPGLALFLLALGAAHPALATHLLGGEMTYRYLDANGPAAAPLRYELTVTVYNNCGSTITTTPRASASVGIYDQATGARVVLTATNYASTTTFVGQPGMMSIQQTSLSACISPAIPPGCTITGPSLPYRLQKFVGIVNLPVSTKGYYALFTDGNRNIDVTNLYDAGSRSLTLYVALNPPLRPNHSPVFSDVAVAVICANDTTFLLNNAVDADGDRLTYSFGRPYGTTEGLAVLPMASFTPLPPLVPYATGAGYSATTPFGTGTGNFALLNASTGIAKYGATTQGKYAVAVDVNEYRTIGGQEVLIGTTRRDLQLVVVSCPATKAPVLPPVTVTPRSYTMEAGSTLSIPVTVTQADGHPLLMTLNSVLLDGAGGYQATLGGNPGTVAPGNPTGTATAAGTNGTVTGTLVYTAGCGDARPTPYDVAITVKDNGCAGKTVADVLHISVTKPPGPTAITGDQTVCGLSSVHSYTASGGTAPKVSWRVVGGTFVNGNTGNPVQVKWAAAGTGTIVARGLTQYGCLTDSVAQSVAVAQAATLAVAGKLSTCQGSSTTLAVTGGNTPYTVTGGPAPLTGTGPFVLSPTQTTTYTITGTAAGNSCGASAQVTVTVNPLPGAVPGAAATICSDSSAQLGGPPVAGFTYSWSPATGLSSPAAANPTVTLTNTTGAAVNQTYTLTTTNPATACASAGTVVVTVNPAVTAGTIGADQALCAGTAPAPLASTAGASGGTGTYAYQWESSPDNATWTALAGATGPAYAPGPVAATAYFRRRVASGTCAPGFSNVVAVRLQALLVAGVGLATPPVQCTGTALTFTPVPTNAGAAPAYRWFVNNALVATGPTYTSATLANGNQVRVELTPTTGFCASGPAAATVTVSLTPVTLPTVAISAQPALPVCAGKPLAFSVDKVTGSGPGPQYQWQVDGAAVAGAQAPAFTSTQLRDGQTVTLALRTTTACGLVTVVSNAVRAAISPAVDVEAGPDKAIMEGEQVVLEGRASGSYPVVWTPSQGLAFGGGNPLRPVASPAVTTVYTLSAGVGDCADSSPVTVTVLPRVRIPSAISPNGDGQDDTWEIDHIGDYAGNHVLVFNRWGSKIFETTGYSRGNEWNGTIGGQPAPIGTYYYVITLGNGKSYSGPLTVVY